MSDDADSISRREHEISLRRAHLALANLRDQFLQLAAHVVSLNEALAERGAVDDADISQRLPDNVLHVRRNDQANNSLRVALGEPLIDKREVPSPPIPCAELMHLCEARCCKLEFALSTQDLDEGKVRWNYARPYMILQRSDGYCVHNQPGDFGCQVYECRPIPCRKFDCRDDKRIWLDYDKRIPAPSAAIDDPAGDDRQDSAELADELKQRQVAMAFEELALAASREDA